MCCKRVCEKAHKTLKHYKILGATWDMKRFLKSARASKYDSGIKQSFVIELSLDDARPGIVFLRQVVFYWSAIELP